MRGLTEIINNTLNNVRNAKEITSELTKKTTEVTKDAHSLIEPLERSASEIKSVGKSTVDGTSFFLKHALRLFKKRNDLGYTRHNLDESEDRMVYVNGDHEIIGEAEKVYEKPEEYNLSEEEFTDPIVFLPGFGGNALTQPVLSYLSSDYDYNNQVPEQSFKKRIEDQAEVLDDYIKRAKKQYNEDITLVAHSMGGVVAEHYLKNIREDENYDTIDTYISLGTPRLGTLMADFSVYLSDEGLLPEPMEEIFGSDSAREMRLMNDYVYDLFQKDLPNDVYTTSIFGKGEFFCLPTETALINDDSLNIYLSELEDAVVGHHDILDNDFTVDLIHWLNQEKPSPDEVYADERRFHKSFFRSMFEYVLSERDEIYDRLGKFGEVYDNKDFVISTGRRLENTSFSDLARKDYWNKK